MNYDRASTNWDRDLPGIAMKSASSTPNGKGISSLYNRGASSKDPCGPILHSDGVRLPTVPCSSSLVLLLRWTGRRGVRA